LGVQFSLAFRGKKKGGGERVTFGGSTGFVDPTKKGFNSIKISSILFAEQQVEKRKKKEDEPAHLHNWEKRVQPGILTRPRLSNWATPREKRRLNSVILRSGRGKKGELHHGKKEKKHHRELPCDQRKKRKF